MKPSELQAQTRHDIFDGRVHVYKRPRSHFWQCETFLNGKKQRVSSKEEGVHEAKIFAEE